uniref:Homeobox domain-containing protein n=1 Tax=Kalanchoe fedtschenkoi TaxID=63787 RepID=A0A7N0TAD9_KALFE
MITLLQKNVSKDVVQEEDVDEDAFEALFAQLEEDLKNDPSIEDEDGELTEEELAKLESELEEAMMEDDDFFKMLNATAGGTENDGDGDEDEEGEEDEEEEEDVEEDKSVKLKNWQLRRLARALKVGRRKTSIKSLAAELCLERPLVLEMLGNPPPKLLMMSAMLPDESVQPAMTESLATPVEVVETVPEEKIVVLDTDKKVPIHAMQSQWSSQKRLKKVQVDTLERVYRRTKRPTNTMISSIVHVTNLPRKKVVKWFEDKRSEDGVPTERLPYERSTTETVFSS